MASSPFSIVKKRFFFPNEPAQVFFARYIEPFWYGRTYKNLPIYTRYRTVPYGYSISPRVYRYLSNLEIWSQFLGRDTFHIKPIYMYRKGTILYLTQSLPVPNLPMWCDPCILLVRNTVMPVPPTVLNLLIRFACLKCMIWMLKYQWLAIIFGPYFAIFSGTHFFLFYFNHVAVKQNKTPQPFSNKRIPWWTLFFQFWFLHGVWREFTGRESGPGRVRRADPALALQDWVRTEHRLPGTETNKVT